MARHRLSGRTDRPEPLNSSDSLREQPACLPGPSELALVRSTHSTDDSPWQLPLIPGFGGYESKGKTRAQRANSGDSIPDGFKEAAFRHARVAATSRDPEERLRLARGFTLCAIAAYWKNRQARNGHAKPVPDLPRGIETLRLTDAAQEAARAIGTTAGGLEAKEAGFLIGGLYTAAMPDTVRAQLGAHYTPPALCERLLDMATDAGVDWNSARVLDPACGGGAFLSAVAQRMLRRATRDGSQIVLEDVTRRLLGLEVDPFAAWMCRVFLRSTFDEFCRIDAARVDSVVLECDALTRSPDGDGFDLVVGNPPYGRVSLPGEVRKTYRRSLYGHANLYGLFTDLALRYAKPGGIIAYVTPTSFLSGMYFKALRGLLGQQAPPVSIGFVNPRKGVFDDVLQETLLATYRRGNRPQAAQVYFVRPDTEGAVKSTIAGSFQVPEVPEQPWLVPRTQGHAVLIERAAALPHRLRDYGYVVSTGPLVWNRHKSSLRNAAGNKRHPLIWAESVRQGGVFEFKAQKRNHQPYFEPKADEDWLVTDFPCVLLQRTTAKEQERRLIAAELPAAFLAEHGKVVVENHLNMIRPAQDRPRVSPAAVSVLLNSEVVDQLFRCLNGSVAVSAYELEALPLPSPEAMKEIEGLVEQGAGRVRLDEAVNRLYETENV